MHEKSENQSTPMCQIAIIEAFAGLEDPRRRAGQRHTLPLCKRVIYVGARLR